MSPPADILLMFAYHFPPENVIGAARPFRFYKYLSRAGIRCHVITAAGQSGGAEAEYVADPFVTGPRAGAGWQAERAIRRLLLPGVAGTRWSWHAARAGSAFVRAHRGARITVYSTYPPLGAHLAGWQVARRERLRWIADFRDPIAGFLQYNIHSAQRAVFRRVEKMALRAADTIIANTDAMAAQWRDQFPRRRDAIQVIWNGFDPESRLGPKPLPERDYRLLTHAGELYDGRNPTPLLEAIERLYAAGRLPPGKLRVRLAGPVSGSSLPGPEFLARGRRQGWLEVTAEALPRAEAQQLAQTSEGLLLLQPHTILQVPGKLFEYLQIGRPILAFVPPDSPIERILRPSGVRYQCAYAGSSPEALEEAVMNFHRLPCEPLPASAWFEEQFNAEKQAQILCQLIRG